jgi:hypothetical protein
MKINTCSRTGVYPDLVSRCEDTTFENRFLSPTDQDMMIWNELVNRTAIFYELISGEEYEEIIQ